MPYHYDPNQPRILKGHHGGGEWTRGETAEITKARLKLPGPPQVILLLEAIEGALALFSWLSAQDSRYKHAIVEFRAREYRTTDQRILDVENPRSLSPEEVNDMCPKFQDVQDITNWAAKEVRDDNPDLSPRQYGNAVHTRIATEIDGPRPDNPKYPNWQNPKDPNFKAEASYLKGKEEGYGGKGTIRVDVYKNVGNGNVYDIKTGQSRLSGSA